MGVGCRGPGGKDGRMVEERLGGFPMEIKSKIRYLIIFGYDNNKL